MIVMLGNSVDFAQFYLNGLADLLRRDRSLDERIWWRCEKRERNCCGRCQTQSQPRCEWTIIGYSDGSLFNFMFPLVVKRRLFIRAA